MAVADPVQGSEKGPVSHPGAKTDPNGPNAGTNIQESKQQ
jgi:hypothetical protein